MQSPYHLFFNVLYSFGFQTSYKLGFCWLFTLFIRRLARCSSWVQGEVGSTPPYLAAIQHVLLKTTILREELMILVLVDVNIEVKLKHSSARRILRRMCCF